ncbi:MAG: TVP38/TMEM64 family protein [Rhodobacter sp.]|uniref:TVP38/TMEM64 family protein n=1 Tax=Pararhodobacter sp. TaxID=2127056 RepID=UPI001D293E8D|nr:VTT domain-containing protein [Pararhodobacter sp.]MCB1343764.1 TVP38/TMEM64 family protein [Paracoccaceae bacterium]MCC0074821.1 TVP38/TMEM64 family protein [Rhodobacter sp.]HPD90820.1 VTT domain-containing protein [Pararhodobacter sp.]
MTLRRWLPLIVIALGAALGFVLLRDRVGFDVLRDNQLALLAYRADHPVLMPVLFVGAYALFVAFSLPGAIWFTLAGGFLFGVIPGVLYNVGAATIGALALFLAVRTGLGEGLRARIDASDGAVRRLTDGLRANEVPVLLSMRLIPVVPFFIANLIPAFLGVGAARFAWTTALGIVPGGLVYTWVGAGTGAVFARGEAPDLGIIFEPFVLGPILGLAALSLLPVYLKSRRR